MGKTAVIAVGGNSLIKDEAHMTVPDQYQAACETMIHIADMIMQGWDIVITHGNGPQVGFILARSEYSRGILHEVPLDSIGADTQGAIGYNFQMALGNEFKKRNYYKPVVSIVTQTIVAKDDPAFQKPSKPIGQFYNEEEAMRRMSLNGWKMMEDAGRGWRRVVPSPRPLEIIELPIIETLIKSGVVVIAVGGGGIPVIKLPDGTIKGVEAVIDKDLASSLLARCLKVDIFLISTAVDRAYLNFGKPNQKPIDKINISELKKYMEEGHFKPGSMLPKIQACIAFIEGGGKHAIITSPENIPKAIQGLAGTHIYPD